MVLLVAILWAAVVTILLVRAATQYKHYETVHDSVAAGPETFPLLTVVIPARNEAANIGRCLRSLLVQDYPRAQLRIVVVNDNSTDTTPVMVLQAANGDPRVKMIEAGPLPSGWAGKPHACWLGSLSAEGSWLCFLDADTVAEPSLLSTAVREATQRGLQMLSLSPRQEMGSFWERIVLPAGFFLLAFQQDLRRVNISEVEDASVNGQFLLFRHEAYDAIGGHAGVRAEICEDSALARAVKRSGGNVALLGAEKLIRTRMYTGLFTLWEGLSKNVTEMLGGLLVTVLVAGAALFLACVSVAAPLWAWHATSLPGANWTTVAGGVIASLATLALLCTHISGAFYFGIPWTYGFLFPLGYTVGALIALNSTRLRLSGRVAWKGRVYEPPVHPQVARNHVHDKT